MTNEELIQKIRAEIERRKIPFVKDVQNGCYPAYLCALMDMEDFLSTLESEKPIEGLEEEINRYLEPIHTADIQFEPFTQMTKCARHFAEWGAEHLKK